MESPAATVISVRDGVAIVSVDRRMACKRCASGKGCGAGLLAGSASIVEMQLDVPAGVRISAGDTVELTLEPQNILKAAVYVYGLPLLGVVIALSAARVAAGPLPDGQAVLIAIAGLLAGLAVGRIRLGRKQCLGQFTPGISPGPVA